MKLERARVRNYRSIRDSGWFDIEREKSILVGTNESGKTALLRALQTLNAPEGEGILDAFRDFPRALYGQIERGELKPERVPVAEGIFSVDPDLAAELAELDTRFSGVRRVTVTRFMENNVQVSLDGVPSSTKWKLIAKRFESLRQALATSADQTALVKEYGELVAGLTPDEFLTGDAADGLATWLKGAGPMLRPGLQSTVSALQAIAELPSRHAAARRLVLDRLPVFVYYSSFTTLRPRINLATLADRLATGDIDPDVDAGNVALFKLVGLDPAELSKQGRVPAKSATSQEDAEQIQIQLAKREYSFSEAAKDLTAAVRRVWGEKKHKLEFRADGDYVRVVVIEGEVAIDLDQRSAGFVWLVSFYVVFKADASDNLANAILLLDEPGLSLHALKQQQFRDTVSLIAKDNQTIYTTHSPFMVGPDELDLVRVVENRGKKGTSVLTRVTSSDPASLFPLQAALGYSLAQSLFAQQRNLVCEGLTDYWYIDGMSSLLGGKKGTALDSDIALVPAGGASRVVYFAVLLHSQKLKVAALLDSDTEGQRAADEEQFIRLLGKRKILRTADFSVAARPSTTEDMLRETLIQIASADLGWDITKQALKQPDRPLVSIFEEQVKGFSKYRLAKAFLKWAASHVVSDLSTGEIDTWKRFFKAANTAV